MAKIVSSSTSVLPNCILPLENTTRSGRYAERYNFKPARCIKASFYIPGNRFNFPTTKGFKTNISMKLVYLYIKNFFNFPPTSSHHPLQVENCDSNSWRVVNEDDNGKFRLERVNHDIVYKYNRVS